MLARLPSSLSRRAGHRSSRSNEPHRQGEQHRAEGRRKRGGKLRGALALGLSLIASAGCAHTTPPPAAPAPSAEPAPPLLKAEPASYVAAAGLRWLILAKPQELLANQDVARAIAPLVPPARLERYAEESGVKLTKVPAALIAGFDYATLYVAQVGSADARVEELFQQRLVSKRTRQSPHPELWRTTGVIGQTPATLVRIDRHLVGVSVGDPTPARVVEAFAQKRLARSPTALRGAALRTLPASFSEAPLVFYAPGPFLGEWEHAAQGLLGHCLAVGVSMRPLGGGLARFTLLLSGDFGEVGAASTARLMDAWDELSQSSTGALFGLDRLGSSPVVSGGAELLKLELDVDLERLIAGLFAAVAGDVEQLMELPTPKTRSKTSPPVEPVTPP